MTILFLVLAAIIGLAVLSVFLLYLSNYLPHSARANVCGVFGVIGVLLSFIAFVVYITGISHWYSAGVKAELINKEYKTEYTQEQIYFASDVVNVIQEIKRSRIDLRVDTTKKTEP